MNVRIDKEGRIVLPKIVRKRLGLKAGTRLEVREAEEGILLTPVNRGSALVEEDGILVHTGKLPAGWDWDKLVEKDRELRIRELWQR